MSNWRQAAKRALGRDGGFSEVSEKLTSQNLPSETRMNAGAKIEAEVYPVYPVYPVNRVCPRIHFLDNTTYSSNFLRGNNHKHANPTFYMEGSPETPDKPNKPNKPQNAGYSVPQGSKIPRSIVVAVNSGDPEKIAAVVAFHPSLAERSAIREFEGGMTRLDADLATLLDVLDEAEN